jgi:flagellar motility protein MotE (MotC chaperone)
MNSRLVSPVPAAVAAFLLSVGVAAGLFWFKTDRMVVRILAARQAKAEAAARVQGERKAQGWDFWTLQMEELANELKEQKGALRKKSDELDQREARLAAERQELDRIRTDIEGMQKAIEARVVSIRADEVKNLKKLAETYAGLSPPSVVAIFKQMDDATAVKILSLMKPDVVGPIFEEFAKEAQADSTLAKRVVDLSERLRLMKSGVTP